MDPDRTVGRPSTSFRSIESSEALKDSPDFARSVDSKLVIVARKDIKLSPGKLAAQVGHAAVDCALKAKRHQPDAFDAWYGEGQKKVVVKAENERALFEIKLAAEKAGLTTALIADAGHTELAPGTITVLGVGPGRSIDVDKVTGHLPLF